METERLADLVRRTEEKHTIAALGAVAAATAELERVAAVLVRRARNEGATWAQIAEALGVSRQAVHQKYGRARRSRRRS